MMEFLSDYQITDFILFSQAVSDEILGLYNQALWPGQVLLLVLSVLGIVSLFRRNGTKLVLLYTALSYGFVAHFYMNQHFVSINWSLRYFVALFLLQMVILFLVVISKSRPVPPLRATVKFGAWLFAACAVIPFNLSYEGDSLGHALLFGWGPDATALGSVGVILSTISSPVVRVISLVIPSLWLVYSALMHWGLYQVAQG